MIASVAKDFTDSELVFAIANEASYMTTEDLRALGMSEWGEEVVVGIFAPGKVAQFRAVLIHLYCCKYRSKHNILGIIQALVRVHTYILRNKDNCNTLGMLAEKTIFAYNVSLAGCFSGRYLAFSLMLVWM